MADKFEANRAGIWQITWSGFPLSTPQSIVGAMTVTLTPEEFEFVSGPVNGD